MLGPFHEDYRTHCPSKMATIKNRLIGHFVSFFINLNAPQFYLIDRGEVVDLLDAFSSATHRDKDYTIDATWKEQGIQFVLHAFLLPKEFSDDEKGNNAVFYGAHGRSVQRVDLDNAIGLKKISGDYVFFGYVESSWQDTIVNQERTYLSWPDALFEVVHKEVLAKVRDFLGDEIQIIRKLQTERVQALRDEHLRFLSVVKEPAEFAANLALATQSPEDIYVEMARTSLRQYSQSKNSFHDALRKGLPSLEAKAAEFTKELKSESVSSLAEYVMKRKLILDVFEERLKFKSVEDETYYFEEAVHELICPLRTTSDELSYDDHNLWIVDNLLAFYTYFASDKTLKATTGGEALSTQEPDIAIFDLGLGFDHAGSNDPITIVEFKRPRRNDYTLPKNPFVQVRDYVTKLRKAGVAVGADGAEIRTIDDRTPFMCFVVADITESLRDMMNHFGPFHRKAGHGSFYKWDEGFSIFIEVASYAEVLRGAKSRNHAFFGKLGLNVL